MFLLKIAILNEQILQILETRFWLEKLFTLRQNVGEITQLAITCSKLTIEILEYSVKYVQG